MPGEDDVFSNLEIVFWWFGDDSSPIEDDLEDDLEAHLEPKPLRRRRLPRPRRRPETPV